MSDRNVDLVSALVGLEHRGLYQTSATFHAEINLLAQMAPTIIDALALAAAEEEARIAELLRITESAPGPRILVTAEDVLRWEGT